MNTLFFACFYQNFSIKSLTLKSMEMYTALSICMNHFEFLYFKTHSKICLSNWSFHLLQKWNILFSDIGDIFEGCASIHLFFPFINVLLEGKCQCSHFHFTFCWTPIGNSTHGFLWWFFSFLSPAVTLTVRLAVGDRNKRRSLEEML